MEQRGVHPVDIDIHRYNLIARDLPRSIERIGQPAPDCRESEYYLERIFRDQIN